MWRMQLQWFPKKTIHVKTIFKTKVSVDKIKNEKKKKKNRREGEKEILQNDFNAFISSLTTD